MSFSGQKCSQCGRALADNALDGLCGACLLRQALELYGEGSGLPETDAMKERPETDQGRQPGRRCEESDSS